MMTSNLLHHHLHHSPGEDNNNSNKLPPTTIQNPPRELCCPITQELLRDPVIAEDGQSYEHAAIRQWFVNNTRSPVTNEELPSKILIPNHALRRIVEHHRASLGSELLGLCSSLHGNINETDVGHLIDRNADLDVRDPATGNTCLHFLVSKDKVPVVEMLIRGGADATIVNEKGETPSTIARRRRQSPELIAMLDDAARATLERRNAEERNKERRREEQRRVVTQRRVTDTPTNRASGGSGLPIVAGTGFFPSLFGLQFQGALEPARAVIPTTMQQPTNVIAGTGLRAVLYVRLTHLTTWIRGAFVGREITPEDERQVQFLSRVLLALGSGVLFCLIVL